MLGGYGCGVIMRALYVLPLCCPLRLSDGAPVLRAWLCGCGCFGSLGCPCLRFSLVCCMRKGSARFIPCRAFCVCPSMNFRRIWFPLLANPYPLPPLGCRGFVGVAVLRVCCGVCRDWWEIVNAYAPKLREA